MSYEVKEAKKAAKEAKEAYNKAIRDCHELMCSIDFTGYLPKKLPEEVLEDILGRLPEGISEEKVAYEIACYYWRARCEADADCVVAKKAIDAAKEVIMAKEEVLRNMLGR